MTVTQRIVGAAVLAIAFAGCGGRRIETPSRGGEKEMQLVEATIAVDVPRVRALLADGADPNTMVDYKGYDQSAWLLALDQLKPKRDDMSELIRLMLKSGARPDIAWGTGIRQAREQPSFREQLGKARQQGSGDQDPMWMAVMNASPDAVRALLAGGYKARGLSQTLIAAVESDQSEVVHMLVEAGADVNAEFGTTPLVAAVEQRDVALMTYLEEHGAREKP